MVAAEGRLKFRRVSVVFLEQEVEDKHHRDATKLGAANGRNPLSIIVPCHRVVRTDGSIGQYSLGGPDHCSKDCASMSIMVRQWTNQQRARAEGPVPTKPHDDQKIPRRRTDVPKSPTCAERHPSTRVPSSSSSKIMQ